MTYDWMAALAMVATVIGATMIGRKLVFKVPELVDMRDQNKTADKPKMSRKRYREWVKVNTKTGMYTNLVFNVAVLPWFVTLAGVPIWMGVLQALAILFVYDLMYYFTHRFLFHGRPLRKIHALHHQARTPTYIDSMFVHPVETFIGLNLFLWSLPIVSYALGAPVNWLVVAVATLLFTQLNTVNHAYTNLPRKFPFTLVDYITGVHAAHHIDMTHGNYATLTMLFDWLLGTYEKPVRRATA